jgi:hypothetical protein
MQRPRARVVDLHRRHASITVLGFACFRIVGIGTDTLALISLEHTRTRMDAFIAAAA